MKYLLTGGNGFLGKYLAKSLASKGELIQLGRSSQSDIYVDFSGEVPSVPEVDMVIHAAGTAHFIPKTLEEKALFHTVNVQGTEKLLKRISGNINKPKAFIFISSVSVYGRDTGALITEEAPLLGTTPYAVSKIQAERLIVEWGEKEGISTFILRLPLIVGENAPGNLGAMHKAIQAGYYFRVGNEDSCKSMVLAEDVARLVPTLTTSKGGIFNLTDGVDPKISDLDSAMADKLNKTVRVIPQTFIKLLAKFGDTISMFPINTYRLEKLTGHLTFDCSKAKQELNWSPKPVLSWFSN
ncbi:NAD-dependent epimerase/dehydratase family protein [Algoriphagus sp. D3-2-R+10]|uniref:NAD-dependent epimerase/dehydratase family protein n=1 Tax=Algoriphagus aurantiacus TaxID=3103948 RepID=UPI002B38920E|nr:NAD-dependent epimerase/dehydratase family protein [Algoriphagus sp. D3-2-R+10]MEB2777528.1 NAD-dependent epimerase/dehydratase family protein [Algoriphagus sp. D3-2-R+10]